MTPCPVCETPNPPNASECATCGKVFFKAAVPDAPASTLAELELGRIDAKAIPVPLDVTPDLDLGRTDAKAIAVPLDITPDLDLGRSAAVQNVVNDPTPEMEQTAIAEKEWTPMSEGPVVCRACGTPQTDLTSILCGNCGRKLPVLPALQGVVLDAVPVKQGEQEKVKCFSCGARVYPAELCSDCGMPMKPVEAI